LPIKTLETVGTGAYAAVEKVDICGRLYARKSILLPRYNRKRARETLQNEVAIIRKLEHPHIVRVLCTYEESSRFAIVLEPLATCDLEVYLHRTSKPECAERKSITEKWLECLSGTLSFIHAKGVRHKDIKTRNILVKDGDVLFADFGSSHMFHDEDNSITEGPAYGHTLMYCSPEVVEWQKRGRAADVFSLGCVFTELLT
ncbi:kinase-like protein, partial [Aaosphaeria arxii CBS 175.79]